MPRPFTIDADGATLTIRVTPKASRTEARGTVAIEGDATRRDILRRVLAGDQSITRLAASYDMSFAAVQKHVAVLERAGLLTKRRQGREALASGDVAAVRSVGAMLTDLEELWRGRISRMDELLATGDTHEKKKD